MKNINLFIYKKKPIRIAIKIEVGLNLSNGMYVWLCIGGKINDKIANIGSHISTPFYWSVATKKITASPQTKSYIKNQIKNL